MSRLIETIGLPRGIMLGLSWGRRGTAFSVPSIEEKIKVMCFIALTLRCFPRLIFPLGMSTKTEVLEEARRRFGDLFDDVAESNDLCFLSSARRKALLRSIPGPIVDREGRHVGRHDGIGLYTVGQRKGLGLAGGPWYVVEIDAEGGCVVVGRKEDLFVRSVYALFPSWHRRPAPGEIFQAQHRYRTEPCRVRMDHVDDRSFSVTYLDRPQPVAPGQSLVLYDGERVLGGGVITKQEEGKTGA